VSQEQQQSEATTETTGSDEVNGSAPSDQSAGEQKAGSGEQPAQASPADPAVLKEWNGEMESLLEAEWYKALPEQHQNLVKEGLQSKLGNFERGYQAKFQDIAKQKTHLESEIRAERERIQNMLYGVDDPTKDVRAELERAVADKKKLEGQLAEFEQQQAAARVEELVKYVETNAKEVYESDVAWDAFVKSLESGIERDQAIKMASALIEAPKEKSVPDSIDMMAKNSAAAGTESVQPDDYETVRRRLLAQG